MPTPLLSEISHRRTSVAIIRRTAYSLAKLRGAADWPDGFLPSPRLFRRREPALAFVHFVAEQKPTLSAYSHSIVKYSLQFVSVCRSLPQFVPFASSLINCRESMGQIWVTVFRVIRGNFTDHGGSRQTAIAANDHMGIACQRRQGREAPTGPSSYDGSPIFDLYSSIRSSEQSMPAASKTIFSVSIFT